MNGDAASDSAQKDDPPPFDPRASPFLRYRLPRQSPEVEAVVQLDTASLNGFVQSDTPMMDHPQRNRPSVRDCDASDEELGLDFAGNPELFSRIFASTGSASHLLGELLSTVLCGNDITSSCCTLRLLYGNLQEFIRFSLFYALPLNGGSYTIFLNTSQKWVASFAGSCSFLSYVATAVVSAATAVSYGSAFWGSAADGTALTVALFAVFFVLTLLGLTESATFAVVIFIVHIISLMTLIVACFVYMCMNPHVIRDNWQNSQAVPSQSNVAEGILIGFGAGMLGITGFETSCNFLEEQKPGVFAKTLRDMWVCVPMFTSDCSNHEQQHQILIYDSKANYLHCFAQSIQ
eukprot:ANDGO_04710.mRNA.1 hypothetical protein DICPUDRAFT_55909